MKERAPLFQRDDRVYFAMRDSDQEVRGSELLFLRPWEELPVDRPELEARMERALPTAVYRAPEDGVLEAELQILVRGTPIASVYLFITEEGLELNGWVRGDEESKILADLEQLLSLSAPPR